MEKLEDALVEEIFITILTIKPTKLKIANKRKSRASIKLIYESSPLGTAGGLFNLPVNKPEKILIMNCDIISDLRLEHLFRYLQRTNVIFLWRLQSLLINCHSVWFHLTRDIILRIKEKPIQKYYVSSGVNTSSDVLGLISKDEAIDMPELINRVYARGYTVNMFPIHEPWIDLGRQEDIENFEGGL